MAAAIRCLITNVKPSSRINYVKNIIRISPAAYLIATRSSSYQSSNPVRPLEQYPDVEVVHNAPEWKYVERVLPKEIIPKPLKRADYPSGWKYPVAAEKPEELKYFIARTKNHMVPVYLTTRFRGLRRITMVKRIQGDIWSLEKDLRAVIEKARGGKLCASRVNEMSQQIHFHGDYVDVVREYLKEKGF